MITHLEPDIPECEVKWALGSITMNKASGRDGIPVELVQILKDDAVKVLHSICQQIWKTQQWPQDWRRSVFIPIPKKGNAKECSNYGTIAFISHASKVKLKILQGRLQQYVNCELPDFQAVFRKGIGTRDQIVNICWIIEKAKKFQKNIYFCFIDYAISLFLCGSQQSVDSSPRDRSDGLTWYSHLFKNFPQFIVIHTVKDFGIVNKAEMDVFLELSCFFNDLAYVGSLIS